jgi:hypothetical protein
MSLVGIATASNARAAPPVPRFSRAMICRFAVPPKNARRRFHNRPFGLCIFGGCRQRIAARSRRLYAKTQRAGRTERSDRIPGSVGYRTRRTGSVQGLPAESFHGCPQEWRWISTRNSNGSARKINASRHARELKRLGEGVSDWCERSETFRVEGRTYHVYGEHRYGYGPMGPAHLAAILQSQIGMRLVRDMEPTPGARWIPDGTPERAAAEIRWRDLLAPERAAYASFYTRYYVLRDLVRSMKGINRRFFCASCRRRFDWRCRERPGQFWYFRGGHWFCCSSCEYDDGQKAKAARKASRIGKPRGRMSARGA